MTLCRTCSQAITLLNSQRRVNASGDGIEDQCLPCAITAAPMLYYTLKRKQQLIAEEVICQAHYQIEKRDGHSMGPLATREVGAGYVQTVVPYAGDHPCQTCADEAERQKGSSAA